MSVLAVQRDEKGLRAALLEDGRLCAYRASAASAASAALAAPAAEQIYLVVCDRAMKSPRAAFVRLPGGASGFLPDERAFPFPSSGQTLLVQVKRAPIGDKKAFLTRDIALAGQTLLLLPFGRGVALSKRVEEAGARAALLEKGRALQADAYGLVLRSAALNADSAALLSERDALLSRWADMLQAAKTHAAPCLLWGGENAPGALIREEGAHLEYVLTNAPESLPPLACPVRAADDPFLLLNVEHKLARARRRTVPLKSGAYLVVDRCEALTVIDVNSGQSTSSSPERVDIEAAKECARLLRLLNLGGMVLIDFIDLPDEAARARLTDAMREALARDPVKTVIHDITPLGIMEITRRRADAPLSPCKDIPCPHCLGTGVQLESEDEPCDG